MPRIFVAYIEKDVESGRYFGIVPGVAGAHTEAETLDDMREKLTEVLELCLSEMDAEPAATPQDTTAHQCAVVCVRQGENGAVKHYYSTMNEIVLTHSDMLVDRLSRRVYVYFERPTEQGFDFAEGVLPECVFTKTSGFSEDDLLELQDYLKCNALLIWDYAQKGGGLNA
jgi:predicted RNase H-like HicB family nuclease